ncbi:MAG: MarR family winged helix-turn-helix transcriptional regulator [Bacteroidota bacterium]
MKLEEALHTSRFRNETHKASLNILYTSWWLKTTMSRELKVYGLTHEQFNVMRILKGKAPEMMCVKDIAGRMIERNSNVPRIIDRLVEKKLVKRQTDSNDKRHTVVQLTPAGIRLLEKSTAGIESLMENLLVVSEKEASSLNTLLEKIREKE